MKPLRTVIFAKAPRAGAVKTRLIPALGAEGAATLARRMLVQALTQAIEADIGRVELCRTPGDDPLWQALALPEAMLHTDQGAGDLGERLARASRRVIEAGESVLLIGSDCPALDAACLREIAQALVAADAVMVPALDGGYVALALQRFDASLFSGIAWSTGSVAASTRSRLVALGWSLRELPALADIDEPGDLSRLPQSWWVAPDSNREPTD